MSIVENIVGLFAPVQCLACGREGSVLCQQCIELAGEPVAPRCAGCKQLSVNWKTCPSCKSWLKLERVLVVTAYSGLYERIVREMKFGMQRPAADTIARLMSQELTAISGHVLCPIPTAPSRVRERGFDHAKLIAKRLHTHSGLPYQNLLERYTNVRQLGASRAQRLRQMEQEFYVGKNRLVKNANVLLVDDVMTTGATLSAAAKTLKLAGASKVSAIVFAQKA